MNKIILILLTAVSLSVLTKAEERTMFTGTIQFPNTVVTVPSIRIYYAGDKIKDVSIDNDAKKMTFFIPEQKNRIVFYLLITPDIDYISQENTVHFLKLKPSTPYAFYILELTVTEEAIPVSKRTKLTGGDKITNYRWNIKQVPLDTPANRIPDETIIVRYDPSFVQSVEGGSAIELPKIMIKPDVVKLAGSEEKFQELSTQWFLAALNTDTIHGSPKAEIKFAPQSKTILVMTA